jgi:arginase
MVEAGLVRQLEGLGWQVKFDGHHQFEEIKTADDPPIGILKNPRLVSRVTQSVAKVVGDHIARGELPVTLGGDHSLVRPCNPLLLVVRFTLSFRRLERFPEL